MRVGDNYEMIFDSEGLEENEEEEGEEMDYDVGTDSDGEIDLVSAAPIVVSDILQRSHNQQAKVDREARVSSQMPLTAPQHLRSRHLSDFAFSYSSTPAQSPTTTTLPDAEVDMNLKSRFRVRVEPKPISAELSEAIAIMDREILEEGPPKKRGRGRPKGSTNGMSHLAEFQATIGAPKSGSGTPSGTASGAAAGAKKRGRPNKAPELSMRETYLKNEAKFPAFGCEWYDPFEYPGGEHGGTCPAELQNMETLRRHVYLVHGDKGAPNVCRWKKCGQQPEPKVFATYEEWREHMEKEHLIPYSWHMGDGIQNRGIETLEVKKDPEKLPDYLFRDGLQVTPSIKDQQYEDTAGMLGRKRRLREIRRLAEENAPTELEFRAQLLGQQVPRLKRKGSSN
ncbi:hypothetical protein TruAng_003722 [Truncatella angustata]|nr:hypothetical protein TruAng_003722 [Truncatella angustata]